MKNHLITLADVTAEEIEWLEKPYIAFGKLTTIEGAPGIGKSLLTLYIASKYSLGIRPFSNEVAERTNSLFLCPEDDPADTLKPRVDAMGADQNLIHTVSCFYSLDNDGVSRLDSQISQTHARIVIIDPIDSFLGSGLNMNQSNAVRSRLQPLADLAKKHSAAILLIRHTRKGEKTDATSAGLGSVAFQGVVRSQLLMGRSIEEPENHAIFHVKSNLSALGAPIGYSIPNGNFTLGPCKLKGVFDVLGSAKEAETRKTLLEEAKEFLVESLSDGAKAQKDIEDAAKMEEISIATLRRAKKQLPIISQKRGNLWFWLLTSQDTHSSNLSSMSILKYTTPGLSSETPELLFENSASSKQ